MNVYVILLWIILNRESIYRSEDGLLAIAALGNVHVMVSKMTFLSCRALMLTAPRYQDALA